VNLRRRARISGTLVTMSLLVTGAMSACTLHTEKPQSPTPNQGPAQLPTGGTTVVVPGSYRIPPHSGHGSSRG
jgi:hypothetical protein